ncbi:ATP-dependent DNA helicase RecG [Candidatus Curculioniphilus buchneri]|uniref:ATP-dependent DNA helicase RecG n=1 Tax=Candidatus Curculioniphilus buchneri TaxID=690594 RepID=UPI00376F2CAF
MNKGIFLNAISLKTLSKINPYFINKLTQFGLKSFQDLLLYLPIRYEDRSRFFPIEKVLPGRKVAVQGTVLNRTVSFGRQRMLSCLLRDDSGVLMLRFFKFNERMKNSFFPGQWISAYGTIKQDRYGSKEIIHPEYVVRKRKRIVLTTTLTPIYPTIAGVRQTILRNAIDQILAILNCTSMSELLPPELNYNMMSLADAVRILHRPSTNISLNELAQYSHPAQRRLIFEELLAYHLSMLAIRDNIQKYRAMPLQNNTDLTKRFITALPFSLTNAQKRVIAEIHQDLACDVPMIRLVQGDVGSGKTLVAALAALKAISNGQQVALMVPTELLAEQHAHNFKDWFSPLGIQSGWLAGKQNCKIRETQRNAIAKGHIEMVVGTHAIFQDQISFARLSLVIIDEQHRFGVHQRLAFWKKGLSKGFYPHQLIMTSTPIPRTLAMSIYADLNISIIDELPPTRIPVVTAIIPDTRRTEIIQRIRQVCLNEQRQIYWICTLIESSAMTEAQEAKVTFKKLKNALPELKINLIHGRLKTQEKQELMKNFKLGKIDLLVATTVIEVGVDVPNASLIIIENPERLGLAQLHQLRGRVGRGTKASHCVLLYKPPLKKVAKARLQILRDNNDGFTIAQRDLDMRGPGDLFGTRQAGNIKFRIASLLRDQDMLPEVQRLAWYIYQNYPSLAQELMKRWMLPQHTCSIHIDEQLCYQKYI